MKVMLIYQSESDHARTVTDWLRDFRRQTGKDIEELHPDSREGAEFCRTYDIVEYPSIVALDDEGRLQNLWRGAMLLTIGEVSYYVD